MKIAPWFFPLAAALAACTSGIAPATDGPAPQDAAVLVPDAAPADLALDALDTLVLAQMQIAGVPGAAAVVVKGGQVILTRTWGLADIDAGRPVTPDTLFMLASISKSITATAAMQLYEQQRFGLDDDVDGALGWQARNPHFAPVPITWRELLSHTSSIEDGTHEADYDVMDMDSPIALDAFMQGYLLPGGAYYYGDNWNKTKAPGTHYSYADSGYALAGDLVEHVTGQSLQEYCRAHIFQPLGMNESSFFLRDLDRSHIAMPYTTDGIGHFTPDGYYGYPDYPDGQLRTSVTQLARFLLMFMQSGSDGGARVLQASSVTEMSTQQPASEDGLGWEFATIGSWDVIGKEGGDYGVSNDMYFDPATGAGFILLTNGDVYLEYDSGPEYDAMLAIDEALLGYGETH